ncbi:hypothetical protein SCLCIDRAFT_132908 [Scleroderma citrinum Foug A]|uniref:DUF6593 domain-containing protein n=1 Tax=Scleroderma citrinum Foug A TaxID=1036808 RepID=A0A0C3DJ58_9AGAM|nr:hypothetical protein SCLCIDRAFT_132908 [Scleroderma citrinum Foug A]
MRLTLSSESVRNTVMTNESGQVLYKTSTPFRLGVRTTTIYKVVPNTNPNDMQDCLDAIGEIEWHLFGTSIMRLHGEEMKTDRFIPRHGFTGRKRTFTGPDGRPYRWDMHSSVVVLSQDDATRRELARSYRRCLGILGPKREPSLDMHPDLMPIVDTVVLTFVYVEKLRMDKEEQRKRAAASGGGP